MLFLYSNLERTVKIMDDNTQKAFEMIEEGVQSFLDSDNYKNYLKVMSKFHSYSFNNTMLILAQRPSASFVAGYNSWINNFKRHVNKGEKGIMIFAPYKSTETVEMNMIDEQGNFVKDKDGNILQEEKEISKTKFMIKKVFDITQTSGEPLPELTHPLTGTSKEAIALVESIQEISKIPIELKSPKEDSLISDGVHGYYSTVNDNIVVNKEMDMQQIAKTMIHEYVHSRLHKDSKKPMEQKEIEAESLAFVICDHFGIDTSEYSFNYIGAYTNGEQKNLKSILTNIHKDAHEIILSIEEPFKNKLLEMENYDLLKSIASPVISDDAKYIKYTCNEFMDLNIEKNDSGHFIISHTMDTDEATLADPYVTMEIDKEKNRLYPETYQSDADGICQTKEDPEFQKNINPFMNTWLSNIQESNYKVEIVKTKDEALTRTEQPSKLRNFCKNHGLQQFAPKCKELER